MSDDVIVISGVSAALHEGAVVDTRTGAFVNRDLAKYLVPVHADIPNIGAVAYAVFNASGVRVRDFPIRLDKLLPGLPAPDA